MTSPKAVCVFCGASNDVPRIHLDTGAEFGKKLAEKGITLVYGGGDCGVMGAVANGALKNGGHAVGVFPLSLKDLESEHQTLSEIIIVGGMHERKQKMFDRSDAVVVLPGGFGTMDEMFEVITWKQLKFHNKPIIIFNNEDYWTPLVTLMDNIIGNKFARPEVAGFYKVVDTVDGIFDAMENWR